MQLNTFTLVVTGDEQTSNMLDVAAAKHVCDTIQGLTGDDCKRIIIAKAVATRVTVTSTQGSDLN